MLSLFKKQKISYLVTMKAIQMFTKTTLKFKLEYNIKLLLLHTIAVIVSYH